MHLFNFCGISDPIRYSSYLIWLSIIYIRDNLNFKPYSVVTQRIYDPISIIIRIVTYI